MFATAAAHALSSNIDYNLIWIIVGVFTIAGLAVAALRWLNKRAVREDKIDRVLKAVLANGGDTNQVGDVASRTEVAVKDLGHDVHELFTRLDTHMGHAAAVENELRTGLGEVREEQKRVAEELVKVPKRRSRAVA